MLKQSEPAHAANPEPRITLERVLRELRKRHFGVLSTVSKDARAHSAGVVYGVSTTRKPFEIYVMTRRHLKKARNLASNPNISFVVPLTRGLLGFFPPPSIQFQGRAEIIHSDTTTGVETFKSFLVGRQILKMYDKMSREGEKRICFVRIQPDPVVFTYMVGQSIWKVRKQMESGLDRVDVSVDNGPKIRESVS